MSQTADHVLRTQQQRLGALMLTWASLEDATPETVEQFIDAVSNSSVPEAAGLVGDSFHLAAENEQEAKERSTCSTCLARTYRGEECVCPDGGDAENYDEVLAGLPTEL